MNLQPLYDLKDRLEHAAVAGTGLLGEDFRLKRAQEGLTPLAAASPVLEKIRAGLEALLTAPAETRGGALLDLLALVDAVVYTQASTGADGELEPLPPGAGTYQEISYRQLQPLLEALTGTGSGRFNVIQEAAQSHPEFFSDYRILPALIAGLGDSYGELADLNAQILGSQGPDILPLLEEGFDPTGKKEMARRVQAMVQAAGAQANAFFLAQLPQAKKEVRLALIDALGCDPANTQQLLELCRTERKGEARDRARCALLRMETPEAEVYLTELSQTAPDEMLEYLAFSSSQIASRLTAGIFCRILDQMQADPDAVLPSAAWKQLKQLCSVLEGKTGPEVCALYRRLAGLTQQQLDQKVEGEKGKPVAMRFSCFHGSLSGTLRLRAALSLCTTLKKTGDLELCRLAIQLQEQAGEDFLAPALTARLITRPPEDSYAWAEQQLFQTGLLGSKLRNEAVEPFQTALGFLTWDSQAESYQYNGQWWSSQWTSYRIMNRSVTVPPLDLRWFSLLAKCGRMDSLLLSLLRGRRLSNLPRQVLVHLCHSAERSGDYAQVRNTVEVLTEQGWTEWDGFACRWATSSSWGAVAYWNVLYLIEELPISSQKKAEQLRQINQLVGAKKIKIQNGFWPAAEIQKYLDKWDQAAQAEGEENMAEKNVQRLPAEELYQRELEALISAEQETVPTGWRMSPRSVLTYITGGVKVKGVEITPKYMGNRRLVEIAIATLVTDRALLLIGEPGTAKSWLSEHLTAAVNGDSTKVVQGTAGTTEEQIRYSWNYAMLIAKGPSLEAMVKSPVYRAMETGSIARIEEISRCASEVQDALISILSEKRLSVPELGLEVPAAKGFSVIATANTRDKGVNDMSAALKRRFNIVVLPTPSDLETELEIVRTRVSQLSAGLDLNAQPPEEATLEQVVTIFRELRAGSTLDGKQKLKPTSGVLSTAEAISLLANSMALAGSFGSGTITPADLAAALQGAVVKDEEKDKLAWKEYLENVMKKRGSSWLPLYRACRELER